MLTLDDQIKNILPQKYSATDEVLNEGEKRFREGFNYGVNKSHKAVKKRSGKKFCSWDARRNTRNEED